MTKQQPVESVELLSARVKTCEQELKRIQSANDALAPLRKSGGAGTGATLTRLTNIGLTVPEAMELINPKKFGIETPAVRGPWLWAQFPTAAVERALATARRDLKRAERTAERLAKNDAKLVEALSSKPKAPKSRKAAPADAEEVLPLEVEVAEADGYCTLKFNKKPGDEIRAALKDEAFRWHAKQKRWQRKIGRPAWEAAGRIASMALAVDSDLANATPVEAAPAPRTVKAPRKAPAKAAKAVKAPAKPARKAPAPRKAAAPKAAPAKPRKAAARPRKAPASTFAAGWDQIFGGKRAG